MPDGATATLAVVAGFGLGAIYFGGLWWTVRRAGSFRHPAWSMLLSVLVRMSFALPGFYLVAGGSWQRLLLCLFGFLVGRAAVSRQARQAKQDDATGIVHAP